MPGAFKLDHLHHFEPLLFWNFSNFFTFILGGQFLLPQRANLEKRKTFQPQNWIMWWVFRAWDIQTGPFAAPRATLVLKFFQLFSFDIGEPILITPEGHWDLHCTFQFEPDEYRCRRCGLIQRVRWPRPCPCPPLGDPRRRIHTERPRRRPQGVHGAQRPLLTQPQPIRTTSAGSGDAV